MPSKYYNIWFYLTFFLQGRKNESIIVRGYHKSNSQINHD